MSCPNSTSPIDINLSTISGKCDLKCDYSFKYYNSSCIATNRADYIIPLVTMLKRFEYILLLYILMLVPKQMENLLLFILPIVAPKIC